MKRALICVAAAAAHAAPLIDFPTSNHAVLEARPQDFFMYVERDFEGGKTKPWQGGQFGYVRGPARSGDQIVYRHLHEGADIAPTARDAAGEPLDDVRAAAAGRVVHVSRDAGASNYGRFTVVEHRWEGSPYFSLYAHLNSIAVEPGQIVEQGEILGRMGHTGAGIDRVRAHLHFEVGMMVNSRFDGWHAFVFPKDPNRHGIYNGLNLSSFDPIKLLLTCRDDPSFRIARYIGALEPDFKVGLPNSPNFELIRNYPWLVPDGEPSNPPSWAVSFTRHGVPVKVEALDRPLTQPVALWFKPGAGTPDRASRGMLAGSAQAPRLTESGLRFARLLTWPD